MPATLGDGGLKRAGPLPAARDVLLLALIGIFSALLSQVSRSKHNPTVGSQAQTRPAPVQNPDGGQITQSTVRWRRSRNAMSSEWLAGLPFEKAIASAADSQSALPRRFGPQTNAPVVWRSRRRGRDWLDPDGCGPFSTLKAVSGPVSKTVSDPALA